MKKTFPRRLILSALVMITAIAAIGCKDSSTTTTTTTQTTTIGAIPQPTNLSQIFFQGDGYAVTYGEFYNEFKINDGINQLLMMVDEIMFASYLAAVTPSEVEEKIQFLTYGSMTEEEIAALTESERAEYQETYETNMFLSGYQGNEEAYVRMLVAKEDIAREAMVDPAFSKETWYVGEDVVASYYKNTYFQDITAIKIRCLNEDDATNVLQAFNLVLTKAKSRLYTGTTAIDKIPSFGFNESNTRVLTDAELVSYFLQMYNYVYGEYREAVDVNALPADLIGVEEFTFSFVDESAIQVNLAEFMFGTLSALNDETASKLSYSYDPIPFPGTNDSATYLILKVADPNGSKVDLSEFKSKDDDLVSLIGQADYDEIVERYLEKNIATTGNVSKIISAKRAQKNFEILDHFLGMDYQMMYAAYELADEGSTSVVARFDGDSITADEFIVYAMDHNATLYSLYAAQTPYAMKQYFPLVYCAGQTTCELDLALNPSQKLKDHEETLAELKTQFEESYYSMYYEWNQWLFLAYGVESEADMIRDYYVKATLQPYVIYDGIRANEWSLLSDYLQGLIQEYYDGYFDLFVDTLSIQVDRDENGVADDYPLFRSEAEDLVEFDALIGRFETAIRAYLDASTTHTFSSLIRAYNKALRTDATWGEFKRFGLTLFADDLTASESLTYQTALENGMEEAMLDALGAAYAEYNLEANVVDDSHIYSEMVETSSGSTLILVEKGSNFEKPSAIFTNTQNNAGQWVYSEGIDNVNAFPSLSQLQIYCEYRFDQMVYGNDAEDVLEDYGVVLPKLPASLIEAMDAYFAPIHDSMYVVGYFNIIVADQLAEGTYVNTVPAYCDQADSELKLSLSRIREIYYEQVFGDYSPEE